MPNNIFISVDFPALFSPTSAWICLFYTKIDVVVGHNSSQVYLCDIPGFQDIPLLHMIFLRNGSELFAQKALKWRFPFQRLPKRLSSQKITGRR